MGTQGASSWFQSLQEKFNARLIPRRAIKPIEDASPAQPSVDPLSLGDDDALLPLEAVKLIIECEVTDRANYEKNLSRPTWPGLESGLTIAIGYDVGFVTPVEFYNDFSRYDFNQVVRRLRPFCGYKGYRAQRVLPDVQDVVCPWETAIKVFKYSTLPQEISLTRRTFPNCDLLPKLSLGALVSLVYNRGTALKGQNREEMLELAIAMEQKRFSDVPNQLLAMQRVWPAGTQGSEGLCRRRRAEADLFNKGLA
jgi:hypothetical protein